MPDTTSEKAYYGRGTHGFCRHCKPPRQIFAGMARPVCDDRGVMVVELKCSIHGTFTVTEESLEIHGVTVEED